jgi:hypothetical protein
MQNYNCNSSLHLTFFLIFVYFIVLIKCLFLFFVIFNVYLKIKNKSPNIDIDIDTKLEKRVLYYKNLTENIFIVSVSILLIYLFNPYHDNKYLDIKYVKFLFFIYGIITLITFDWNSFI